MIRLTDLADELLDIIVDHCPLDSLATCLISNKAIRERCNRDGVWTAQALARWRCVPDVRGGGATRRGFENRLRLEGDATVFYAVIHRCGAIGESGEVLTECSLAPGDYGSLWRRVAAATAMRARRSAPGVTVQIEVGELQEAHRRVRSRTPVRCVLTTTSLRPDEENQTFFACLAAFPVVQDPGGSNSAFYLRKRAVGQFLRRLSAWHGVEQYIARSFDRSVSVRFENEDLVVTGEDAVAAELSKLATTPPPERHEVLDPAHLLERFMVAANSAMDRPESAAPALRRRPGPAVVPVEGSWRIRE
jgi:hypothetical protein